MVEQVNLAEPVAGSQATDGVPGVHELIQSRWSPRNFSSRMVSDKDLQTVFEAARWAASSYNEQPWRFLVANKSDAEAFQKFLNLLVPANQAWAKDAPILIFTVGKRTFSHNGSPNVYGLHDAGQALAHLFLQATALGLHAHGMGGFDRERAREELQVPDDYELGAAVALGYIAPPEDFPDQERALQLQKRQRKPLREIVFSDAWEQPFSFSTSK
jgi:nitroreductase